MELIRLNFENNNFPANLVCCIGEFDGIHFAHQALIKKVVEVSKLKKLKSAVITFDPHPDYVLNKSSKEKYITPLSDKALILEKMEIDYLLVINFDNRLSNLSYIDFYDFFLKSFDTIIIGYDFKFGYKGIGSPEKLTKLHKNVIIIDKIIYSNKKIGTKDIVSQLLNGNLEFVNKILGRNYKVTGKVIEGSKIGNKIGYPTANLLILDKYYEVKSGVYCVNVLYENKGYLGIANYGVNPSFNKVDIPRLEVHIFNFEKDIYNEVISVEFIEYLREEIKFENIEQFLKQMKKDCDYCISKYGG